MRDVAGIAAPTTLGSALRQATADLRAAGIDEAGNDARRLLAWVLDLSAAQLLSQPERAIGSAEVGSFSACIARRIAREPVSRILGEREFFGRGFAISPATLDPRPDSETLVEATLELVASEGWTAKPVRILDVGTGSGCLLLSLLAELPLATGVGTDKSAAALEVARANAYRLGVAERAAWLVTDVLESIRGAFDVLICNPPYIPAAEIPQLDPEVRCFDPLSALDGGSDGLLFFRRLAATVGHVIADGWIVLEVGHDQADAVVTLLSCTAPSIKSAEIRLYRDAADRRRCVAARARN